MYIPLFQGTTVPALILYCLKLYILLWSMIVGLDSASPLKTNKTPLPTTTYSDVLIHSLALSKLLSLCWCLDWHPQKAKWTEAEWRRFCWDCLLRLGQRLGVRIWEVWEFWGFISNSAAAHHAARVLTYSRWPADKWGCYWQHSPHPNI